MQLLITALLLFVVNTQVYTGYRQDCSFANFREKRVTLTLLPDNSFTHVYEYSDVSGKSSDGAELHGVYAIMSDTLFLSYVDNKKCCAFRAKYIITERSLLSTGSCYDNEYLFIDRLNKK